MDVITNDRNYTNYEDRSESKERFPPPHTKIFIDNRKEKEYAGFITHLHLLLHIVTWTLRHLSYRDTSLLIPSSYQKAAWLFCVIANVR